MVWPWNFVGKSVAKHERYVIIIFRIPSKFGVSLTQKQHAVFDAVPTSTLQFFTEM